MILSIYNNNLAFKCEINFVGICQYHLFVIIWFIPVQSTYVDKSPFGSFVHPLLDVEAHFLGKEVDFLRFHLHCHRLAKYIFPRCFSFRAGEARQLVRAWFEVWLLLMWNFTCCIPGASCLELLNHLFSSSFMSEITRLLKYVLLDSLST